MPSSRRGGSSGQTRQAISRGIVTLHKKHIGRGPTNARAYINDDLVTIFLQETLTDLESTLVDRGEQSTVEDMRHDYQDALRSEAVALIETETGREVIACVEGHSVESDHAVLCFLLESEPDA